MTATTKQRRQRLKEVDWGLCFPLHNVQRPLELPSSHKFYVCEGLYISVAQLVCFVGSLGKDVWTWSSFRFWICYMYLRTMLNVNQSLKFKVWRLDWNVGNWRPHAKIWDSQRIGFWFRGNIYTEAVIYRYYDIFCITDSYLLTLDCWISLFSVPLLTIGETKAEARGARTATSPTKTWHAEEDARTTETGSYVWCARSYVWLLHT